MTSGLAIAALVLGILSPFTCMLTALPAIIVGAIALVKISGSKGRLGGFGLAVAGMALPVVLLPIVALGLGIMMPALVRVRQLAFRMTCGTNLSGLGVAMKVYANDHDGRLPTPSKWCDLLIQHVDVSPETFRCHGHEEGPGTYAMNRHVQDLQGDAPPDMVLLFETWPGWNQVGGPEILATEQHQTDGCNILFMDGHVEFVRVEDLPQLRWTAGDSPGVQSIRPRHIPDPQTIAFPSEVPTRTVEIVANLPDVDFATWQNTGVALRDGDVLYIQAEGEVNYVSDLTVTADGRGNTFPPSLLPNVSFAALVGRTHFGLLDDGIDSSGTGLYGPGFVGSQFKTVYRGHSRYGITGDNVLYLAVNDSMDNDNSLSFTAHIWIVRDGQVVHEDTPSVRPEPAMYR